MLVIRTKKEMNAWSRALREAKQTLALVPTMGYLHEGHLSLIREALKRTPHVVVSIFVNPTQFGPNEDFSRYPRKEADDLTLCAETGAAAVFLPSAEEMYTANATTWVDETALSLRHCGADRPGHFRGVCTVVSKLFNIVQPDFAVFGQKDFQQTAVIRRMVRDLDFPIEIITAPIIREADGLAKSSRNTYLTPETRPGALSLSQALFAAKASGERDSATLEAAARKHIEAAGWSVDYATVIDSETLEPKITAEPPAAMIVAARQNGIRLIDNLILS